MAAPSFQLAEYNFARLRAPLDAPEMAELVAFLDPVNAHAERCPGFVWRLTAPGGGPSSYLAGALADPMAVPNLSVWTDLGALRAFFEERAHAAVSKLRDEETLKIDAAVAAEGATEALLDSLEAAGPFGAGHPAPAFAVPRHRIVDARLVGSNHIRVELRSDGGGRLQAMAFRAADTDLGRALIANRGRHVHVAGTLSVDSWQGRRQPALRVIDVAEPGASATG